MQWEAVQWEAPTKLATSHLFVARGRGSGDFGLGLDDLGSVELGRCGEAESGSRDEQAVEEHLGAEHGF